MACTRIPLGSEERVALLYSYPNAPDSKGSLASTVLRYLGQTLRRDGLAAMGATVSVRVEGPDDAPFYFADFDGPEEVAGSFDQYAIRLPQYLNHGWDALTTVIPMLKSKGLWDPTKDKPKGYRPWRFYMPHGLAMIHQRALQFFHYPPIRLLEEFQDYLYDPVPFRVEELMMANGVASKAEAQLYETVMDATPIAAADDQGSKKDPAGDPVMGLIPIQHFPDYQRAQVRLLLNASPTSDYYTIPIVVYGSHPRDVFNQLYGVDIGVNRAATAEIVPGKKTPVLGSNHPYRFYAQAQITKDASGRLLTDVGAGTIAPGNCAEAVRVMQQDLAVARWLKQMSDDPSLDPQATIEEAESYWDDSAQASEICALVRHEGSLRYPDPASLDFRFDLSLDAARDQCRLLKNDPCAASVAPAVRRVAAPPPRSAAPVAPAGAKSLVGKSSAKPPRRS